jgi:hypothetical protein
MHSDLLQETYCLLLWLLLETLGIFLEHGSSVLFTSNSLEYWIMSVNVIVLDGVMYLEELWLEQKN